MKNINAQSEPQRICLTIEKYFILITIENTMFWLKNWSKIYNFKTEVSDLKSERILISLVSVTKKLTLKTSSVSEYCLVSTGCVESEKRMVLVIQPGTRHHTVSHCLCCSVVKISLATKLPCITLKCLYQRSEKKIFTRELISPITIPSWFYVSNIAVSV